MNLEVNDFLRLVEQSKTLAFYDLEATGLRGDYNSILCVSIKPFDAPAYTFQIKQPGNDEKVVRETKEALESYDCICGYYSKGFDKPMINTRLLKWKQEPLKDILHIDMYYLLKSKILTARRSQGHLLSWLQTPEEKMTVGADVWNEVLSSETRAEAMKTMVQRCESDVTGVEALYKRTKHLIKEIKRN